MKWLRKLQGYKVTRGRALSDAQVVAAFAVMAADSPQWVAFNEVLARQIRIETDGLLAPNLTDSAAQYNRGRVAALEAFADTVRQIWEQAQVADR